MPSIAPAEPRLAGMEVAVGRADQEAMLTGGAAGSRLAGEEHVVRTQDVEADAAGLPDSNSAGHGRLGVRTLIDDAVAGGCEDPQIVQPGHRVRFAEEISRRTD